MSTEIESEGGSRPQGEDRPASRALILLPALDSAGPAPNTGPDAAIAASSNDEGVDLWSRLRAHIPFPRRLDLTHAATIAIAVVFGVVLGSLGGAVFADLASSKSADPVVALQESIRSLAVEVRSLKQGPDLASSLTDAANALSPGDAVSAETTGSVAAAAPALAPGWVLWRVKDGRALVHGDGGYYEVEAGATIPGLGLVEKIAREDGRWVVTTANGLIVAPRG